MFQSRAGREMDGDPVATASCNPLYTYPEPQIQHGSDESLARAKRLDGWEVF
jgi:hypothetical protein